MGTKKIYWSDLTVVVEITPFAWELDAASTTFSDAYYMFCSIGPLRFTLNVPRAFAAAYK